MFVTFSMTFANIAKLLESLMDHDALKIDLGRTEAVEVKELLYYLREYPNEVVYFDAIVDESKIKQLLNL